MLIKNDDIKNIIKNNNIKITGVLHLGAHECEEISVYNYIGIDAKNIIWIDALENKVIQNKNRCIPNVYNAVISDQDDKDVEFNIANNSYSSSILEFGKQFTDHPDIKFIDKIVTKSITLNTFFERNNIDGNKYNFWNFNIQGAELLALKGAINYIKNAKIIYLRVNAKEVYKGCSMIYEIDQLLSCCGFVRKITEITTEGYGDALYIQI